MLRYVHNRVWLLNSTLHPAGLEAGLPQPIHLPVQTVVGPRGKRGHVVVSKRSVALMEHGGHDIYPALDLRFDDEAVAGLAEWMGEHLQQIALRALLFRLNDMGLMQILAEFEVLDPEVDLHEVEHDGVVATRLITQAAEGIDAALAHFEHQGWITLSGECHFGVPSCLEPESGYHRSDTYLYGDHYFFTAISDDDMGACLQQRGVTTPPVIMGDAKAYTPWATPLWSSPRTLAMGDYQALLAADTLMLSESLCYSAVADSYRAILEQDFMAPRRRQRGQAEHHPRSAPSALWTRLTHLFTRTKSQSTTPLSSRGLIRLMILNNIVLQRITSRRSTLDSDQSAYLVAYEENFSLKRSHTILRETETTLKLAVQDREGEERQRGEALLETILFFFTGLTLYSALADILGFLQSTDSSGFEFSTQSPRFLILVAITCALVFTYLMIRRFRR